MASEVGKRVAKNTLWLLVGRIGSQGMALLFSVVIARRLGEIGLGQYAFIASVIFLGNLASTFGTDMLVMRAVAGKRDLSVVPRSLTVQLMLSVPFILVVFFGAPLLPNQTSDAVQALRIYSLALIPMAVYSVSSALLRGLERMSAFTWLNLFNGSLLVALTWFFVQPASSIVEICWLLFFVQLLSALAAWLLCLPQLPALASWKTTWAQIVSLLVAAAPIAALGLLGAVYQRTGIFLLATMQGAAVTGSFSAALRLVEAAKLGHFALLGALFPAMSQAHLSPRRTYRNLFNTSLNALLILAIALAALLFIFADFVISLLFGQEFIASVPQLKILAWLLVPVTLTHFFSLRLLAVEQEKAVMVSLAAALGVLIVFTSATMALWGVFAPVWGLLLSETVQAGLLIFYWRKQPVA
ncbi:MAG: oligosaccharide flippase family protein [Anaerolineales bacterium]